MVTSVYPRGLLPSGEVVDRWATITDAATWAGLEDGLLRCVLRALGDQSLNNLPLLASIPFDSIKEALNNATRGDRSQCHRTQSFCFDGECCQGQVRSKCHIA